MTETFADHAGVRLWTASSGHGVPVVLCNGGPGCCDYLAPVASMFDDLAQVIRFEASGCGRSDHAPSYSVARSVDELEAVRRHYDVDRWIVGGHSWGADLALIYALHYPDRVAAVVCLAGGRFHNDREWHRVYAEGRDQGRETPPVFDYPYNSDVNQQVNQSWKQYVQRPTLLRELAQMDRPALFVYGERDIRPSWAVEQVASLLPNATFVRIAGADHFLWTTHAAPVRETLRAFVPRV